MLFTSVLVASAFAALANAQVTIVTSSASSVAASTTVSQVMPPAATQGFDISQVDNSTLFSWCLAQQNTCPQMCGGAASQNSCNPTNLQYVCVCSNGTVPDSSAFQQTVPFFVCQTNYGQCVQRNANMAEQQAECRANEQCGTRNATAEAIAATQASEMTTATRTSSSSRSGSATAGSTGSATSASTSATASGAASVTSYTSGAFAVMLMAAFKLLL